MPRRVGWKRRQLASILSRLAPHPKPLAHLEQYTIDSEVAARVLWMAAYTYGDVDGKMVYDLGCGTGRLGLGAFLLGATKVVGIDVDKVAIKIATKNAAIVGADLCWIIGDIDCLRGRCDTVIQNPPFGVQRRRADRRFLNKALEIGKVIYSLHKGGRKTRKFIEGFVQKIGGKVTVVVGLKMPLPSTLPFHRKRIHITDVDLFRMISCRN